MTAGDIGGSGGPPPAGWYPDATNPDHERLWTGERWVAWIRPVKIDRIEANPAGWRVDIGHPGFERLWSGEMWTEEIRRVGAADAPVGQGSWPIASAATLQPPPSAVRRQGATYHDDSPPDKLRGLGNWVRVALVVTILAQVAELVADQVYIGVQRDILDGRVLGLAHVESVVHAVHTTRGLGLIVGAITAILFLVWFYRAYRNLVRAGIHDLRFGPGWALGGWFIPFFNWVRPKQIANDIWKASASAGTVGIERRYELELPALINWWWGLWILGGLLAVGGNQAITKANADVIFSRSDLHHEMTGVWVTQAGVAVGIVAAVLALLLVGRISRMQDENFAAHPGLPGSAASAVGQVATEPTKICPDCAEEVKAAARVCRFCGYRFDDAG
jgi:Domain of unknown function (DUF4328)/Uncharacterised protein family UPF0547/Protein of unknown function (DUF2510)